MLEAALRPRQEKLLPCSPQVMPLTCENRSVGLRGCICAHLSRPYSPELLPGPVRASSWSILLGVCILLYRPAKRQLFGDSGWSLDIQIGVFTLQPHEVPHGYRTKSVVERGGGGQLGQPSPGCHISMWSSKGSWNSKMEPSHPDVIKVYLSR